MLFVKDLKNLEDMVADMLMYIIIFLLHPPPLCFFLSVVVHISWHMHVTLQGRY